MKESELVTTQDYFTINCPEGLTVEEYLQAVDADGYTKEECMLLDESIKTLFYNNLHEWEKDAEWYREQGYCVWDIVKMTDGRIAVLTC